MKILIGLAIFLGVAFVISLIEYFRGDKELSFGEWIVSYAENIGRGASIFWASWFGRIAPRLDTVVSDSVYFYPSAQTVTDAVRELAVLKIENGFTKEGYVPESKDCDNAALHDWHYLSNVILPDLCSHLPEAQKKGFACGMFSFKTDGGARHRVAYIIDDQGKKTFIDTFEKNGTILRELSDTEKAAGFDII